MCFPASDPTDASSTRDSLHTLIYYAAAITRPLSSTSTIPSVGDSGLQLAHDHANKGCFGMQCITSRHCVTGVHIFFST